MRPLSVLCLLLVVCGNAAGASTRPHVALKDNVAIDGTRVTLSAVIDLDGDSRTVLRPLLSTDLGPAPLPGYSLRLSRADIVRRVRMRLPGAEFDWSGAEAVRIERQAEPFDGTALLKAAELHLRSTFEPLGLRLELQAAQRAPELQLPRGAVELKPRALHAARSPHRDMTVWIDILVDGIPFRTIALPFRVAAFGRVLVSRRELDAGSRPGCAELDVVETDLASLEGTPLSADCSLVAGHLKRRLGPGTPLLTSHIAIPAAVTQGDQVTLRVAHGAIALETRAIALMNGEVGQPIDVRTASSRLPIRAEVVAPGVVALTMR